VLKADDEAVLKAAERSLGAMQSKYPAQLGKKKVELQLSAMGLQVYEEGSPVPKTHLFQLLQKWTVTDDGLVLGVTGDEILTFMMLDLDAE
jgi:hypothetical protein